MIQSNELRIGNLILLTKDDFLTTKEYCLDGFDIYKLDESDCEDIKPIPLTEEWLLKFGFVVTETNAGIECFYFGKRYSVLQPVNTNVWLLVDGEKGLCEINHVHQLQNLYFALTNEELKLIENLT